jgi:predicted transcriptional regulator
MTVDPREKEPEKRQFLIQIDADLIRRTKIMAIERRVSASSLVQQAVEEFLSRQGFFTSGDAESR